MRGNYSAIRHCERTLRSNLLATTRGLLRRSLRSLLAMTAE